MPLISKGCPPAVADLDLSKPGLFEASAGTGKTYAIEHLVLRLLIEHADLDLRKILILTFTEKATGELKEKIRSRIAARLAQGGLQRDAAHRLRDALLGFDAASIHTIHGFCERVLRKYAFENQSLFRKELVKKDRDLYHEALIEGMRSDWLDWTGEGPEGFEAFREMARSLNFGSKTKWDDDLVGLARDYNPARGDRILPEFDPDAMARTEAAIVEAIPALTACFPAPGSASAFLVRYKAIRFKNATIKKAAARILEAALEMGARYAAASLAEKLQAAKDFPSPLVLQAIDKLGYACLRPAADESDGSAWPELERLLGILEAMRLGVKDLEVHANARLYRDQRRAVLSLREKARAHKTQKGIITFNDMIEDVWKALEDRPECIAVLRQEYRYCLVDEFQDTDGMQWDIFRKVFLESGGGNPLFLIGDPKQAIYRFRGGDIHTYMAARGAMFALSREGRAQGRGLDVNYRSSRAMVAACNAAFPQTGWFRTLTVDPGDREWRLPAEPDSLGYVPVGQGGLTIQEAADTSRFPAPMVLKEFAGLADLRKGPAQKIAFGWIAAEIEALLAEPSRLRIPDKESGALRPLAPGDICVLVKDRFEKDKVKRACLARGIPVQVERQPGLYSGDAAGQILAVLEALENPRDPGRLARALLTRFFRASGDAPLPGLPESIHPLFEEWTRLAERRRWQRLFHSLWFRTGILYRESLEPDGDRRIMDLIHVGQNLVRDALARNLGINGVAQSLRDLRLAPVSGEDEQDMHREDSEGGKVKLMTMHVSKGLEFPVVFLAASSAGKPPGHLKYKEGSATIFNLETDNKHARQSHFREAEDEEKRLFYVAFTRARYKLYVPVFPLVSGRGSYGPLGGFVANSLRTAAHVHPDLFAWSDREPAPRANAMIPTATGGAGDAPAAAFPEFPADDRLARPEADFSRRRRRLSSYSHLARHGEGFSAEAVEGRFDKEETIVTGTLPSAADPESDPPSTAREIPGNRLPRGRDVGNMLHEILEDLDFAAAGGAVSPEAMLADVRIRERIKDGMAEHRLGEEWLPDVAALLWNALSSPLPDPAGGPAFRLAGTASRKPEMEFLFAYGAAGATGAHAPDGAQTGADGYLWGFIDLVFRHGGRYYLLDWKSNHLEDYGPESLDKSMRESRYDLQYMLYSLALDKWLRSLLPEYRREDHFGGVFYLYLRGMNPEGGRNGVFALRPSGAQLDGEYPAHVARALGASGAGRAGLEALLAREGGMA